MPQHAKQTPAWGVSEVDVLKVESVEQNVEQLISQKVMYLSVIK